MIGYRARSWGCVWSDGVEMLVRPKGCLDGRSLVLRHESRDMYPEPFHVKHEVGSKSDYCCVLLRRDAEYSSGDEIPSAPQVLCAGGRRVWFLVRLDGLPVENAIRWARVRGCDVGLAEEGVRDGRADRCAGPLPRLSLIHISEPTRPY